MDSAKLTVRQAEVGDIPAMIAMRLALFQDLGYLPPDADTTEVVRANQAYLSRKLQSDEFVGWLAEYEGRAVATASLVVLEKMPTAANLTGLEAYLMGVYTAPAFRRMGAGELLVRQAIAYTQERGIPRLSLHASDHGRPLYERLGFRPSPTEMRWTEE